MRRCIRLMYSVIDQDKLLCLSFLVSLNTTVLLYQSITCFCCAIIEIRTFDRFRVLADEKIGRSNLAEFLWS